MTKLKLVSWIILLLAFSGISGFLTVLIETPAAPKEDYPLMAIVGTISVIIVVGLLALIPFFLLRKSIFETRLKRAFQVYTFFCIALIGVAYFKFPEAMEIRSRAKFLESFDESLHAWIGIKVTLECNLQGVHLSKKEQEEVTEFIFTSLKLNDKLVDKMRASKSIQRFVFFDPEMTEETRMCIDWKMNTTK